jgi:hypothetical protein
LLFGEHKISDKNIILSKIVTYGHLGGGGEGGSTGGKSGNNGELHGELLRL